MTDKQIRRNPNATKKQTYCQLPCSINTCYQPTKYAAGQWCLHFTLRMNLCESTVLYTCVQLSTGMHGHVLMLYAHNILIVYKHWDIHIYVYIYIYKYITYINIYIYVCKVGCKNLPFAQHAGKREVSALKSVAAHLSVSCHGVDDIHIYIYIYVYVGIRGLYKITLPGDPPIAGQTRSNRCPTGSNRGATLGIAAASVLSQTLAFLHRTGKGKEVT